MPTKKYQLVLTGRIVERHDKSTIKDRLAILLKTDHLSIYRMFTGQPTVCKQNLDKATAQAYLAAMIEMGVEARIVAMSTGIEVYHGEERRKLNRRQLARRQFRRPDEHLLIDRRRMPDRRLSGGGPAEDANLPT